MKNFLKKHGKKIGIMLMTGAALCVCAAIIIVGINIYMIQSVSDRILSQEEAVRLENVDCVIVPGCRVWNNGTPSLMLSDRLDRGIALYKAGAAPKLLMSGDHGQHNYDEVNAMKDYAMNADVPSEDVFMDHAGFSTYETMYRAGEVFEADTVIIVTQEYHLYRAVYIANALGLEAYGVSSDYHVYPARRRNEAREMLARTKDFMTSIYKPEPTYLGEVIPISGNGDLTNDR